MRRWLHTGLVGVLLLAGAPGSLARQALDVDLRVDAPPSLAGLAERVRSIDQQRLAAALARAGLAVPPLVQVTLIPEADARARATPRWVAGAAFGSHDVVIFPARVGSYPYASLESVVSHEVAHLALSAQAGDRPLPRWFHEGVAISVEQEWGVRSQVRLLLTTIGDPGFPALGRLFESESQPDTARAYLLAAALVSDVQRRHGAAVPGAIAVRVANGASFPRAFQIETGDTPADAAMRAWVPYQRWTNWIPVVTSGFAVWMAILALACLAFIATLRKRVLRRRQWADEEP